MKDFHAHLEKPPSADRGMRNDPGSGYRAEEARAVRQDRTFQVLAGKLERALPCQFDELRTALRRSDKPVLVIPNSLRGRTRPRLPSCCHDDAPYLIEWAGAQLAFTITDNCRGTAR